MDAILLNLLPNLGIGAVFITALFLGLSSGKLLTKGQHESILAAERLRGDELKESLLLEKKQKEQLLELTQVLVKDTQIIYDFFREVGIKNPDLPLPNFPSQRENMTRPKEAV